MDEAPKEPARPQNSAVIEGDNVLTVRIHLNNPGRLAMAIGSLEMAKDVARDYFHREAIKAAQRQAQIIRPGLVN